MNINAALALGYNKLMWPVRRRGFNTFMRVVNRIFAPTSQNPHTVKVGKYSTFTYPSGDPYWHSVFMRKRAYEPELLQLFDRLAGLPNVFFDCGANFGYWSVILSERVPTVAVEASSHTLKWLEMNRRRNADRFKILPMAINDGATDYVSFLTTGWHAGRAIVTREGADTERVPAVSIDRLIEDHASRDGLIFIKLDVEGAEIPAFRGASKALTGNTVILYEDHGHDLASAPTAYLLEQGMRVFFLAKDGTPQPITSAAEATALKHSKAIGYNFVALGTKARFRD